MTPSGSSARTRARARRSGGCGVACWWTPAWGTRRSRVRRHLPLFQWSNPSLKDHLALFTHGVVGQWTIPKKTGRDYIDQVTAEVREEREDSRGRIKVLWVQKRRDNHYLDCELMIDAAAVISGFLEVGLHKDNGQRLPGSE
ncbi:MAG: phage terminase large subunit family protein [Verrucomicrobia bacterium]|nr:phage terminase large subunit family protein [Verrucomicrobiota bacterium]